MAYKRLERFLIQLDTVDSTNDYASKLLRSKSVKSGTLIVANHQHNGKGQRSSVWTTEGGKNLTASLIIVSKITIKHSFYLNIISSLSVRKALKDLGIHSKIKWPNDILIGEKKVCGILIENQISGEYIVSSIVGIGVNVNQKEFTNLTKATSIINELDLEINLQELLDQIYGYFDFYLDHLLNFNVELLKKLYYEHLYLLNDWSDFEDVNGLFKGKIEGIDTNGRLLILTDNGQKTFDMKEVSYC
jgi:BirA family transcriptional regulator, biotin operon repressor / biotin---[acetyl-CoA-carboxylase] ligase